YYWKPAPGIQDTTKLTHTVKPDKTTTYYLCGYRPQMNLVNNGNFEYEDSSLVRSGYYYIPGTIGTGEGNQCDEGAYKIVQHGKQAKSDWVDKYDHTFAFTTIKDGWFMAINAANVPNVDVWRQDVQDIVPNTDYVFYTWIVSLYAKEDYQRAELQFSINGELIGPVFKGPFPETKDWERFYVIWNSGNSTSATISIVNQSTVSMGNDLGLDDIYFSIVEPDIDSVTIYVGERTEEEISVSLCHGESYSFGGRELTESGTYHEEFKSTLGCDSIITLHLTVAPPFTIDLGSDIRVCRETSPEIVLSSPPGDFIYEWSTGATTPSITVDQSGVYGLTVTNQAGCVTSDSISVTFIKTPEVEVISHTEDFCEKYSAVLEAVTDASNVVWSNGDVTHTITVDKPGVYRVTARREMCNSNSFYVIEECDFNLYFPTAISPGGADGLNDYFAFSDPAVVDKAQVCIYNRYGQLLFYSEDPYFKWDGSYKNKLCPVGSYSYVIHIVAKTGKSYYYKGVLFLI
ncbi:gliding motility-associated C-terminal domain-containing protein, partial [Bacteroidales bacterium OttesenSCG-928-E04]|nr:gliding motility-associated C-terminal domain-containing protein [Bacteroidales bacterium OttesenSCG-928-E04]